MKRTSSQIAAIRPDQAMDHLSGLTDTVLDKAHQAADKARELADNTSERVREKPLQSILLAAVAGAAVAGLAGYLRQRRSPSGSN